MPHPNCPSLFFKCSKRLKNFLRVVNKKLETKPFGALSRMRA